MNLKNLGREVLRSTLLATQTEPSWAALTRGRAYAGYVAKLTPNHGQYPRPSPRKVERHGFALELDISDLIDWYLYFGFEDPSHAQLLAQCRAGDVVLDIGANIGMTALSMARAVGPAGRVYAFEPHPTTFARLARHLELNRATTVKAFQTGLGEQPGELTMAVADEGNRGMNRIDRAGGIRVPITTVDKFVAEQGIERIDLIKVDVEGFEVSVLRGARATLQRHRPRLFLELDDGLLARQGESAERLLALLGDLGYRVLDANTGQPLKPTPGMHVDVVCHPAGTS